ncbi:type III-E CRISPR-associated gRAMP effector Cas7-11, partial [Desulfobacterales bacterium HSG16]|nr:type III-E CRISPR-associated gRAMP effector Cas7-11 [Desulfobacterales bacterium HSG16]
AGTGKVRLKLTHLEKYAWDRKENFANDQKTLGGRNAIGIIGKQDFTPETSAEYIWQEEAVEFDITTPFLTRDPIAALIDMQNDHDEQGNDTVCYKSVEVVDESTNESKEVYLLKGESFRGMLRAAVGRRHKKLLTDEHEDCSCSLCRIFGNEHEAGKIRAEDLIIEHDNGVKHIDRVAIDRFTGGARDKHKFDMLPLSATPDNALCFNGKLWISDELSKNDRSLLDKALADIQNGMYPFGGLGNIGLGWVNYKPAEAKNNAEPPGKLKLTGNFKKPEPDTEKMHWPHYFLPFGPKVKRENEPPTHAFQDKALYTGKLICTLKTLTPLIIPDGEDIKKDEKNHKTYDFFNLNGQKCIPGSEIRGMISSVYETLTNSCLRVFDDKKRLSWRMEADKDNQERFKPGRVLSGINGCFKIEEMDEVRYPFYDNHNFPDKRRQEEYFKWDNKLEFTEVALNALKEENFSGSSLAKLDNLVGKTYKNGKSFISAVRDLIDKNDANEFDHIILNYAEEFDKEVPYYNHPTPTDQRLLSLLNGNRELIKIDESAQYAIIQHRTKPDAEESFMFVATPSANKQGYKDEDIFGIKEGYLKITGPNKVEKSKVFTPGLPPVPSNMNGVWHNMSPLLKEITVRCGENQDRDCKRKRLIPEFACSEEDKDNPDKGYTYSMTKRCERVFLKKDGNLFDVAPQAVKKFEILVEESRENADQYKTPEVFRTILPENGTVNEGDLVYFRLEAEKVVEIIPVRISRKVDDELLGEKLPDDRRSCVREILNETSAKNVKQSGLKPLYQHHSEGLCPACTLFGTGFYKSRISFGFAFPGNGGDAVLQKDKNGSDYITLPLLERPRPTWSMPDMSALSNEGSEYTENSKSYGKIKSDVKTSKVPGRKFYVHHQGWKKVVEKSENKDESKKEPKTENNRTVQALAPEQEFCFEVRFDNLRDWELGLLVYALNLETGLAHKLGMGKPLGFGSVQINVNGIVCDGEKTADFTAISEKAKEKLLEFWKERSYGKMSESLERLFKMLFYIENNEVKVRYPALRTEDDPQKKPGYEELKDGDFKKEERREKLSTPWTPWA